MATFVSSQRGPVVMLVLAAMAMAMMLNAQVAEAAPYFEKFGPYYQHDIVSRPNFTDLIVSRGYSRTEGFGALSVFDAPLTRTAALTSEIVARVQGFQAVVSLDEANVIVSQTLHLPGGSLSFLGTLSIPNSPKTTVSKFHCVGGTGEFESVTKGVYELEVLSFDQDKLDTSLIATVYYHKEESWKENKYLRN